MDEWSPPSVDSLAVLHGHLPPHAQGLRSHRALAPPEQQAVLDLLHCERFMDKAPPQVWAELLDEGLYFCSLSTMYRILKAHEEVRERRNQLRHPNHPAPRLVATAPNQVWSWDITKMAGACQVDVLLSLRAPGHLQPLCRRLDGRTPGIRGAGQVPHRGEL